MNPKTINWQRLQLARWVSAAEGAALVGICEQKFLETIAPALKKRRLAGMKKVIYDRMEIDRVVELL